MGCNAAAILRAAFVNLNLSMSKMLINGTNAHFKTVSGMQYERLLCAGFDFS
jgi:hypothetical protein